jgi:hypothetical protein
MSFNVIFTQGTATVTVPAGEKIAVQAYSPALVFQEVGFPNFPDSQDLLTTVENTTYVSSAFTNATSVTIQAGASGAFYAVGVSPVISNNGNFQLQGAPGVLNATGTLTAAMILSGIVTSTSAAAVTATLDVGSVVEAASEFAIGDSFDWSVINTGPSTFTVTSPGASHTIVGVGAVLTLISAVWRTRKTAADTFISYRLS